MKSAHREHHVRSADAVRNDLRAYVVEQLGDPAAVLVIDETGFVKRREARHEVGGRQTPVQWRRRTHCQLSDRRLPHLCQPARPRLALLLLDRALYLPHEWAETADRRAEAGVPDDVTFATKPEYLPNSPANCWNGRWTPTFLPRG